MLIDEQETVIDKFYANNRGDPIQVVRQGLMELYERYAQRGIRLEVLGLGTTGYGEHMLAKAFGADYHTLRRRRMCRMSALCWISADRT